VHDSIAFESRGIPAVLIASDEFADAATAQACALGMPSVSRVLVPHPIQDATEDELRDRADGAVEAILAALEQS
jgi:hypothetical protein